MYIEFDELVLNTKYIVSFEMSVDNNFITIETVKDTYELEFKTKDEQVNAYNRLKNAIGTELI